MCLLQSALGQCFGRMSAPITSCRSGMGFDGLGYEGLALDGAWPRRTGCSAIVPAPELAASYGGGLPVSSSSATAPTGLAVTSENVYEGPVGVAGNLPFLGSAAVEGVFSTTGAGAISYGCGDGAVAITAEAPVDTLVTPAIVAPATVASATITPAAMNPSNVPWGFKGLQARGCGCGAPSLY